MESCCKKRFSVLLYIIVVTVILAVVIPVSIIHYLRTKADQLIPLSITTSSTIATNTSSVKTTTTGNVITTTLTTIVFINGAELLLGSNEVVYGIYNASAGSDSIQSTNNQTFGDYPVPEGPNNACDNNVYTKYLNFGWCQAFNQTTICGVNTGLYFTLQRGASIVTGLRICTANDHPTRDPLTVTLEGSNKTGVALTLGASWTLIYDGPSGLYVDPGRYICGVVQYFNNEIQYISYRFLITSVRLIDDSVQYSELQLIGY